MSVIYPFKNGEILSKQVVFERKWTFLVENGRKWLYTEINI